MPAVLVMTKAYPTNLGTQPRFQSLVLGGRRNVILFDAVPLGQDLHCEFDAFGRSRTHVLIDREIGIGNSQLGEVLVTSPFIVGSKPGVTESGPVS